MEKSTQGQQDKGLTTPEVTSAKNYKPILFAAGLCALLGPGVGQLYNRKWLKAILMIVFVLVFLIAVVIFFIMAAQTHLEWVALNEPELIIAGGYEYQLARELVEKHSTAISIFKWTFVVVWCYSVVDAFLDAKKNMKS